VGRPLDLLLPRLPGLSVAPPGYAPPIGRLLRVASVLCVFAIVFAPAQLEEGADVEAVTAAVLAPAVDHATPPPATPRSPTIRAVTALAVLAMVVEPRRRRAMDPEHRAGWRHLRDPAARVDRRRGPPHTVFA
jgi:hypothetical protein